MMAKSRAMEQHASFDKAMILMIGIFLVLCMFGAFALMSSETFMTAQEAMFKAMAVMAEVCRL
ncbi:MAG: hypothetical protein AAF543_13355 [Pseudomonadota bacterium]